MKKIVAGGLFLFDSVAALPAPVEALAAIRVVIVRKLVKG